VLLVPADKLPGGSSKFKNDILQIEITRACDLFTCSSCTRLLPFRKDTLHMSLDCFSKAVDSCAGWPGIVALFGGNPCSHPKFSEICEILAAKVPMRNRGLWTNALLGKGEIAKKTFWPDARTNLNVHGSSAAADEMRQWLPGFRIVGEHQASWHSPILMNYRDFGISEEQWIPMREACDINQKWSASLVERDGKVFAHFCEVGSALDGIRGQNNGVEAVPGWWKLPISYFHEQISKCCDAGCGVPLRRKGSLDNADTYDISKSWVGQLSELKGRVDIKLHESFPEGTEETTDYAALRTKK